MYDLQKLFKLQSLGDSYFILQIEVDLKSRAGQLEGCPILSSTSRFHQKKRKTIFISKIDFSKYTS